jgi:hypothetical protein
MLQVDFEYLIYVLALFLLPLISYWRWGGWGSAGAFACGVLLIVSMFPWTAYRLVRSVDVAAGYCMASHSDVAAKHCKDSHSEFAADPDSTLQRGYDFWVFSVMFVYLAIPGAALAAGGILTAIWAAVRRFR